MIVTDFLLELANLHFFFFEEVMFSNLVGPEEVGYLGYSPPIGGGPMQNFIRT